MKKKKETNSIDPMEAFHLMMAMINQPGFPAFGGNPFQQERHPHERLGNGFELRKIDLEKDGKPIDNSLKYSHLYHNDVKVSDEVFRVGGTFGKFKDGYCELIHYTVEKDPKKGSDGFSFGTHVIINELGEIVLSGKGISSYPHHIGGCLGSVGDYIYDLRTGKAISPKGSTLIEGDNCIIVEHRYDWYDKEVKLPLGIYRIDFVDAGMVKIDDVRK